MKVSGGSPVESADDPDADTIELELTPEHLLALTRADQNRGSAAQAEVDSDSGAVRACAVPPVSAVPAVLPVAHLAPAFRPAMLLARRERARTHTRSRWSRWPLALATSVLAIGAVTAWVAAAHRPTRQPIPESTAVVAVPPATAPVAVQGEPAQPPVRFRNPFDRSEVFEFPAGTSVVEARRLAAQVLVERARERLVSRRTRAVRHVRRAPNDTAGLRAGGRVSE
jgi:hypothetical protein